MTPTEPVVASSGVLGRPRVSFAPFPVVALLAVGLVVLSSVTANPAFAAAAAAPVALAAASALSVVVPAARLRGAVLTLHSPGRGTVGEPLPVRATLQPPHGRTTGLSLVVGELPSRRPDHHDRLHAWSVELAGPGAVLATEASPAPTALVRGSTAVTTLQVTSRDLLHLWQVRWDVAVERRLVVHPVRAVPLALPQSAGVHDGAVVVPSRTGDLAGTREWRRGDAVSSLHRRATARRGAPVVVLREERSGGRPAAVVLVGPVVGDDHEHVLARVAATSAQARRTDPGSLVAVVGPRGSAPRVAPSGGGRALLDWWAEVDTGDGAAARPAEVLAALRPVDRVVLVVPTTRLPQDWWDELRTEAGRRAVTVRGPG